MVASRPNKTVNEAERGWIRESPTRCLQELLAVWKRKVRKQGRSEMLPGRTMAICQNEEIESCLVGMPARWLHHDVTACGVTGRAGICTEKGRHDWKYKQLAEGTAGRRDMPGLGASCVGDGPVTLLCQDRVAILGDKAHRILWCMPVTPGSQSWVLGAPGEICMSLVEPPTHKSQENALNSNLPVHVVTWALFTTPAIRQGDPTPFLPSFLPPDGWHPSLCALALPNPAAPSQTPPV